ncbi:hypothetical protein [uncultured Amnibacterium sp.]|uniref:hypothetical protein n=1 Tax=uncultured Amnibacterium sp. TaxID=1631851 RepID=UPI0035CBEE70
MSTATAERTLHPLRHLAWRTTAAGNTAIVVPGATVAVVIAAQNGRPLTAGVVAVFAVLVAVFAFVPALRIRIRLDEDGITTRWTRGVGASRLARGDVHRGVIRTIYNRDGVNTSRHLFLLDSDDNTVHRMNDRWWSPEQLLTVAHHFGIPLETQQLPVHLSEARRTAHHQLWWHERHPLLATSAFVITGFAVCAAFARLATDAL